MKQRRNKPIEVKEGAVTVKIYHVSRPEKQGGDYWQVADKTTGQRTLRSFADKADAIGDAERIAKQIASGNVEAALMTNREAATFGRMVEILRTKGIEVPLEIVASHFADAYEILGGDRIVEAAKDYARRNPVARTPRTVAKVVEEMVAMKKKRGKGARYIEDLNGRLGKFADDFAESIDAITGPEVQAWLDRLKAAPRTVKNFRSNVSQLFKFAESRGYIGRGCNPVTETESVRVKNHEAVEIYTPEEIRRLLDAAPKAFKPILALQAFAGLRSAEVARLEWQDINLAKRHIVVAAHKAKTASRRLVPISANLAAWLADDAKVKGKLWKHTRAYFHEAQRITAERTKIEADPHKQIAAVAPVEWKHNALRHSFISYRLAEIQDTAQVALEAGNSPAMIFAHYRELVTPEDAAAWFAVTPKTADNIIALPQSQPQEAGAAR